MDPGLLVATLSAEYSGPDPWTMTAGKLHPEELGLDDWPDPTMARHIETAVLHVARAIHLGQVVFGKSAKDYRP
ncbi:MAG: hypothetical protein KC464_10045 [Myxococcales bacterium]|nr:hypothetical protein [Myxococcales bacterium]